MLQKNQATSYNDYRSQSDRMAKFISTRVDAARDALSANVLAILKVRHMKRVALAKAVESAGGPVSKTTYNILSKRHPPNLENWAFIAHALNVPLWVLLIPGLDTHEEMLRDDALKRLAGLVQNYMASDDARRRETEVVAHAGAILSQSKK